MANMVYNVFKKGLIDGTETLTSDTDYKVILLGSGFSADADSLTLTAAAAVASEITGAGYDVTSGAGAFDYANATPKVLTTTTDTDMGNDQAWWDATDVTWSISTITARYALIYHHVDGTEANDYPCVLVDFLTDKSSSAGDFTIQWNANGILRLT